MYIEKLVGIKELSEYLDIKVVTLRTWVVQRKIPYHKVGRLIKFRPSEIEAWLEANKVEADLDLIDKAAEVGYRPGRRQPSLMQNQKEVKNGSV